MSSSGLFIAGSYDYSLLALFILISALAAGAPVDLAQRVTAAHGRATIFWPISGALASGIRTWSMRFTGMSTFSSPMQALYDWPTVSRFFLPAFVAPAAALFLVRRRNEGEQHG